MKTCVDLKFKKNKPGGSPPKSIVGEKFENQPSKIWISRSNTLYEIKCIHAFFKKHIWLFNIGLYSLKLQETSRAIL